MATNNTTSAGIARLGSLLADETRAEILSALMSGRAHTGSELSRHVGVAPSTISEHLSKLLDADLIAVEAQGRHRYWRLADAEIAQLLETIGVHAATLADPKAPAALVHARTCYDHLAGEVAVGIYQQLHSAGHIADDDGHLTVSPAGFELFASVGVDVEAIKSSKRPKARSCLDWTQRRHHLAGAAGKELLIAFHTNGWVKNGDQPRSIRITETGRKQLSTAFNLSDALA